jgi:hypothetical protein
MPLFKAPPAPCTALNRAPRPPPLTLARQPPPPPRSAPPPRARATAVVRPPLSCSLFPPRGKEAAGTACCRPRAPSRPGRLAGVPPPPWLAVAVAASGGPCRVRARVLDAPVQPPQKKVQPSAVWPLRRRSPALRRRLASPPAVPAAAAACARSGPPIPQPAAQIAPRPGQRSRHRSTQPL